MIKNEKGQKGTVENSGEVLRRNILEIKRKNRWTYEVLTAKLKAKLSYEFNDLTGDTLKKQLSRKSTKISLLQIYLEALAKNYEEIVISTRIDMKIFDGKEKASLMKLSNKIDQYLEE